jgi:hypothetical protein
VCTFWNPIARAHSMSHAPRRITCDSGLTSACIGLGSELIYLLVSCRAGLEKRRAPSGTASPPPPPGRANDGGCIKAHQPAWYAPARLELLDPALCAQEPRASPRCWRTRAPGGKREGNARPRAPRSQGERARRSRWGSMFHAIATSLVQIDANRSSCIMMPLRREQPLA